MSVLDDARAIVRRARESDARVPMCGLSGKDSFAVASLVADEFGAANVITFTMALVQGLECVEAPVRAFIARMGFTKHRWVPHFELARHMKHAVLMHHQTATATMRLQKIGDVEKAVRKATGGGLVFYGWRKADSITRRVTLKRFGTMWSERVFPIADWSTKDVVGYLRARRISLPERFGCRTEQGPSGFDLTPSVMRYLQQHFPRDYDKVVKMFPLVPVILERERFFPKPRTT